jgi:hypothetical protein
MNAKLKTTMLFVLLICACQKEPFNNNIVKNEIAPISISLDEAKNFMAQVDKDSSKAMAKIRVDWKLAQSVPIRNGNKWTILVYHSHQYEKSKFFVNNNKREIELMQRLSFS